ncbi:sulfite exporter TauE/SafE family protein [Streptomyces sp. ME19-01-6]|uniref:sulfite exporter TauE/SafE family protein n=1 Tax=Streptomyces sp. ME19-01-6 TaxID=3028686 RepID=UPI0029BE30B8|nr:sulfite exporter TauE/SafE family protein [Streptomyces sp. ME19-01-6]MDX3232245.1 sulfite exporter TauE/SafE family protein [Streptomyces sp. ME19-01-6]
MNRLIRRARRIGAAASVLFGAAAMVMLPAGAAEAHPLGNFTVNRYDGLVVAPGALRVDHVEDLAEIPAAQAKPRIDQDGDDELSRPELDAWADRRCASAARDARLTVRGQSVSVRSEGAQARSRAGQAGLPTLRVECRLTAVLPRDGHASLAYRPADIGTGPGWREMTARGDRMTLAASDVPASSASRRLTRYPQDQLSSPPDERTAALRTAPGGAALAESRDEQSEPPGSSVLPRGVDRWTQALTNLVARHDITPFFAVTAFATAMLLGAMHALAPGHGKTLMAAAAAAGGRSALRDVLALGASVTVTHTLGVFALGLLVTAGSAAAPSVIAWLGIASGVLVALAGAGLLRKALRQRAPAHHHHHDEHGHSHTHEHEHEHVHSHGGFTHSHPLPSGRPTLRGTLLLGFAGGLVPSPSAVVVLVGAAALGQAWFGFLLVLAYGAGLALTLTLAGIAVVRLGRRATERLAARAGDGGRGQRVLRLMHRASPVGTAAVVLVLGCGLVLRGAATTLG